MSKNYVLHSTQESRDNGTTSILAIVETLFFVALTWGVAYYYDYYTHIYIAIAIAPFLLLRTPESTYKAIEWFLHENKLNKENYYKEFNFLIILIVSSLFSFPITYFFSTAIFIWGSFFIGMFISINIGMFVIVIVKQIGVRGVIFELRNTKNAFLKITLPILLPPALLIFGIIYSLFLFIKSIIIKVIVTILYTLKYPISSFSTISKNLNAQISVNDIFYSPELLPKISEKRSFYQLTKVLSNFQNNHLSEKIVSLPIIPIWSLGYLYRFSIKSTAWFFFPLAYLANLNALQDEEKKVKAIKTQTWKKLFWFNVMVSAVLALYFKFTGKYLDLLGLSKEQLSFISEIITQLRHFFVPEAMWLLVVAVILYFIMNTLISRQEHLEDKNYHIFSYWIIKLISMLWMVFLGWHLVVLTNQHVLPELPKLFGML